MARDRWSDVFSWPIIGVHAILTPDGKVLTFGTGQQGQQSGLHIFDVWDPATKTHQTLEHMVHTDLFCSAAAIVPETGEILVAGGDTRPFAAITAVNNGVADVNVFNYRDMTLSPSATGDMTYARWYPTVLTLANGKTLMIGGRDGAGAGVGTPELYSPGVGWKTLDGAASALGANDWFYPRAWLASDGRVVVLGSEKDGHDGRALIMDPSGNGRVLGVYNTPFVEDRRVPSIMFDENKVISLGLDGSAWITDFSGGALKFTRTADAGGGRIWSNMTLLADGSVMLSGGSAVDNQLNGVKYAVQIWHPDTGTWTIGSDADVPRLYHSTTLLLPDATVLSLGGGAPGPLTNLNGEIYKPAYLFDGNGNLAERPHITDAPTELAQRQDFSIAVDDAASITRLTLVKYGAVTHSFNMEARKVDLNFTLGNDGRLHVDLPDNANVVTPGYWMLFAFNSKGTPSVAATIHVDTGGERYSQAVGGFLTLNGSTAHTGNDTFTLTPDTKGQTGSVFSNKVVDLAHDFSIKFGVNLGNKDAGADGLAFVMHNDSLGGDAIGLSPAVEGSYGINNGLAIEFDTFNNGAKYGDIASDHTTIIDTDATLTKTVVSAAVGLGNIEDGRWHTVNVSWDAANQTLVYTFDGRTVGTLTKNLAEAYFGGSNLVHFGFTGATGGASNLQQVRISSVVAQFADAVHGYHEPAEHVDCDCDFAIEHLAEFVTLSGSARYDSNTNVATLTPAANNKLGGMMSNDRIDVSQDFTIAFDVFLGKDKGADGMSFVLHNDPVGSRAIGGELGAGGIRNGLAIEFDTYNNGAAAGDIATDHTRFVDTDAPKPLSFVSGAVSLGNIEDSFWHAVQVSWDAETQKLTYSFDGIVVGTLTKNLANAYFGGSDFVHFGFTAITGGANNLQQVRLVDIAATFEPGAHEHDHGTPPALSMSGSAFYNRTWGTVTLTPDAKNNVGGVMSEDRIDITHDFTINLDVFLGGKDVGADGLAFVLHNDPRGTKAIGLGGDNLGAWGIKNGLAIEFDTYNSGAAVGDVAGDHTRFVDTDAPRPLSMITPAVNLGNIENGKWHNVKVTWDADTHILSYTFDGRNAGAITAHLDDDYFNGSQFAHFGATAATGGASNLQQVRFVSVDAVFEGEDPTDPGHHTAGITTHDPV